MSRKRKHDRPRTKSGKRSRAFATTCRDNGTPELQAWRRAMVGNGGDPNRSATMPEIYCERGLINQEQRDKALRLRALYATQFGPGWPSNTEHGPPVSEDYLAYCRRRLEGIARRLGQAHFTLATNFAVYDRPVPRPQLIEALDLIG